MIGLRRGTVEIMPYDLNWPLEFEKEKHLIQQAFGEHIVAIEHVGSTAVPDMPAKPIIDIEIGVQKFEDWKVIVPLAEKIGYIFMPDRVFEDYVFMPKGDESQRTHYLHIASIDSAEWKNILTFRDILRKNPVMRANYAKLKRKLSKLHGHNRAEYTALKTAFISSALSGN